MKTKLKSKPFKYKFNLEFSLELNINKIKSYFRYLFHTIKHKKVKQINNMDQETVDFFLILENKCKTLSFYQDLKHENVYHLNIDGEFYQKSNFYINNEKYTVSFVKNENLFNKDSYFNILLFNENYKQMNINLLLMTENNELKTCEKITSSVFYLKNFNKHG